MKIIFSPLSFLSRAKIVVVVIFCYSENTSGPINKPYIYNQNSEMCRNFSKTYKLSLFVNYMVMFNIHELYILCIRTINFYKSTVV